MSLAGRIPGKMRSISRRFAVRGVISCKREPLMSLVGRNETGGVTPLFPPQKIGTCAVTQSDRRRRRPNCRCRLQPRMVSVISCGMIKGCAIGPPEIYGSSATVLDRGGQKSSSPGRDRHSWRSCLPHERDLARGEAVGGVHQVADRAFERSYFCGNGLGRDDRAGEFFVLGTEISFGDRTGWFITVTRLRMRSSS
jgi:hypothetical protein